jgi:hypothetical protein
MADDDFLASMRTLRERHEQMARQSKRVVEAFEDDDRLDGYLMSNLTPKRTGLPFVVWISPKGDARHDVRIKVSPGPKWVPSEFVSVAIRPDVRVVGRGTLSGQHLALLRQWVDLNRDVLVRYWDGDIEDTLDALAALKPLRKP